MTVFFAVKGTRLIAQDSSGYDPWVPVLPQLTVDTTLPTGWNGTADATPANGAALETALSNVVQNGSAPYIIELTAGATYTTATAGGFKIPNKTGSQWLIIRTSGYASLPAGTRVAPSGVANMAKIRGTGVESAIWFENAAHNVRFIGVEVTTDYAVRSGSCTALVFAGYNPVTAVMPSLESNLPSYITFDRCYLHGTATGNIRRAIAADAKYFACIDSYISDCHDSGADSQAISTNNGAGPFLIRNNHLEAAGENFIAGGNDPSITNLVPSDITFTNNYCYKPLTWKPDDASYDGYGWDVKNIFELKNAQRVLVEGNVFDGCWPQNQTGYAIVITPRNSDNTAPWSCTKDITFRNNVVKNTYAGINILATDDTYDSPPTERVLVSNNLVLADATNFSLGIGPSHATLLWNSAGGAEPARYISFQHNTILHLGLGHSTCAIGDLPYYANELRFQSNICSQGVYGFKASGINPGTISLDPMLVSYTFDGNVLILEPGYSDDPYTYPDDNYQPDDEPDVGFTNYAGGDYSLSGGSIYKNVGTDGQDPGVNWSVLQAAIAGVE